MGTTAELTERQVSKIFDDDAKARVIRFVEQEGPNLVLCGRIAGIRGVELLRHLKMDEEFSDDFEVAKAIFHQKLEREAYRRAVDGVLENVYNKDGDIVGEKLVYSDRMLEILLKANMPEKYREQHNVNQGAPGVGGVLLVPVKEGKMDEWAERLDKLTQLQQRLRDEQQMKDITPKTDQKTLT